MNYGRRRYRGEVLAESATGLLELGQAAYLLASKIPALFGRIPPCPKANRGQRPETAGHDLALTFGGRRLLFCWACGVILPTKIVTHNWQRMAHFVDLIPIPVHSRSAPAQDAVA